MMNRPTQESPDENPSAETQNPGDAVGTVGKAATGAVAGGMIGILADPLTAIAGAITCAVLAATDSLKNEE